MIKKLKIRFICLAMIALTLLLMATIAAMNMINFNSIVSEADNTLIFLSQNKGAFPQFRDDKPTEGLPPHMSAETPYESRYFSVLIDPSGKVIQTETSKIASVDPNQAQGYALKALKARKSQGFTERFRFLRSDEADNIRITFLDCGRALDSFYSFLRTSILMAFTGLVIMFFAIVFFSGKIVQPVAESYEKQKRFITDAGHEIKTPLTVINANIDLMEMDIGENECLSDIRAQAKRLSELTNDLVYLAKMEESGDTIEKVELPISDIISETASDFYSIANSQNKQLICNIQPMLSCCGNDKAIRQLISILMDNAFKYSPDGGTVAISFSRQNKILVLNVFNTTCIPVDKDSLEYVFDRFYRTDKSRNSQTGGYGIGLSIAKAIADSHGAKIWAWSDREYAFNIAVTFSAAN